MSEGVYGDPVGLGPTVNSEDLDFMPFVDPLQGFLIFASERPGGMGTHDIWLCSSEPGGTWSVPVNAGPNINTAGADLWPVLSPDGGLFFVTSGHEGDQGFNPYWMDAEDLLSVITPVSTRNLGSVKALFR